MLKDDNRHDGVLNGVETLENNDTSTLSNKPHSNKQLQGVVHLELPNVDINWDDDQLPREENIQQEVKRAMLEWRKLITNTLETQLGKQAQGAGPLAVVELWRERSMVLRTLVEQLQEPRVKRVSKLAGQLDPESLHGFEVVTVQLETAREDATDNFHLLSTLDRHFKKLAQGRDFGAIAETLPRLLEGLHLVWNISMHYKRGDHMEALMERIAWQVCESARHAVNMCTLFRDDGEAAMNKVKEVQQVMRLWKVSYFEVRARIEASGQVQRWEFDTKKLFEHTDHVRKICEDLQKILQVVQEFHCVFGQELETLAGAVEHIGVIKDHVKALLEPFENVPFDPLNPQRLSEWKAIVHSFKVGVQTIDADAVTFIDKSFCSLHSAEVAFDVLLRFLHLCSRKVLKKQFERKFVDILLQYCNELQQLKSLFEAKEKDPPVGRGQPRIAGAMHWARSLLGQAKQPMLRFHQTEGMLLSTAGKEAVCRYVELARRLRAFEVSLFERWLKETEHLLPTYIHRPLLCPANAVIMNQGYVITEGSEKIQWLLQWEENGWPEGLALNFAAQLQEVITEVKQLEQLGFDFPELARNVALQEDEYHRTIQELQQIVKRYNQVFNRLSDPENKLLHHHVSELRRKLRPGLFRLNWSSLAIPDYLTCCHNALSNFELLLNQVQRNAENILSNLHLIESANLFKFQTSSGKNDLPDVNEFFKMTAQQREADVEQLVCAWWEVSPLLMKIESLVVGSSTGCSPALADYYSHWEKQAYKSLVTMVFRNLKEFIAAITGNRPIFQADVVLSEPDITLFPKRDKICRLAFASARDCIATTKRFVRWMHETCLETPAQPVTMEEEPTIFSFFSDVSRDSTVLGLLQAVLPEMQRITSSACQNLAQWKRYRLLWRMNKDIVTNKFATRQPSCGAYDEKLQVYGRMLKEISAQPVQIDEHGLRLRLSPLIASVSRHARAWISSLSQLLETSAKQQLSSIVTQIQTLSENIKQSPDSLERLRFLLVTIAEIRSLSICVESRILDIQERYRILAMHGLQATLEDTNCVETLMTSWKEVVQEARDVDLNLHSAKKQFKQQMVKETEECRAAIEDLAEQCSAHGPACVGEDLDKGLELLVEYEEAVKMQEEKLKEFANTERLLGLSTSFHPALQKLQADLHDYRQVYDIYSSHKNEVAEWSRMRWRDLKVQTLETALEKHLGDVHALPVSAHALPTVPHLERKLKAFRKSIPPLRDLKQECLRERHWQELMEKSGRSFKINPETFTLEDIFSMELHKYSDIIGEVVDSAAKEFSIEKGIQEVVDTWEGMEFTVLQFLNGKRDCGFILGGTDSILQNLDDSSMLLQSMMGSQHIGPFFITVQAWEKTLSLINEVIEVWLLVQRKWMYLENVFTGGDLRAQLPDEAGRFDDIDGCFKKIMVDTMKNPLIKSHCQEQGRLSELRALNQGLEICQKRLSTYLDSKRNVFPRFFFLSDDDLLNILCKKDPEGLQEHIVKMFDNVASLRLIENAGNFEGMVVTAMVSTEGEEMPFIKVVPTDGPVEEWMTAVSQEMYRSNHQLIKHAVYTYCQETSRVDWILLYQATVILAACQVWWTWEVEDAFRQLQTGDKTAMKDVMKQIHVQIDALVGRVGGSLSPNDYSKLNMVLIIDVHARDIVDGFVRDSVMDGRQFAWESQLRFYWEREQNSLKIHQCTGIFTYGHEYMGLNGRLVITPLTDRIFLTLTQALSMHLGGAPSGPAGTGKTETVKDLAKALGQLCVVTNCSEGMDFMAIGKVLSGLAQSGAWGCFDEFNRIDASVLSVITAQIQRIHSALQMQLAHFQFEGCDIALDKRVGIFITMNPSYAGRTELPESLKSLFRPVVVMIPDVQQICQIMLFSQGFMRAKPLAQKMTVLYSLARKQLSQQHHYDFGLRAIKAVLLMSGELKRHCPELSEDVLLVRALHNTNLPKLVFEDRHLFLGLVSDLFPGLKSHPVPQPALQRAAEEAFTLNGYVPLSFQVEKVVQLNETMAIRHATMVVGPTGGGKSVLIKMLCQAQNRLGMDTRLHLLNPKAVSVEELYGVLDTDTRDWTDGIFSRIFREINNPVEFKEFGSDDGVRRSYVLFDGDVDTLWVENLNSVMDDNKLLTLPNGERIQLQTHCALLFEVGDLQHASPATVSRCGVVFMDPKNLRYRPYWQRWVSQRQSLTCSLEAELIRLFEKYVPSCIDMLVDGVMEGRSVEKPESVIPLIDINLVAQLCSVLSALLEVEHEVSLSCVEPIFLEALCSSLGVALLPAGRLRFDNFLRWRSVLPTVHSDEIVAGPCELPVNTLFDYHFDSKKKSWIPWQRMVLPYIHNPEMRFNNIQVPTVESTRMGWLLQHLMAQRQPALLVGDTGTSKTTMVQSFLQGQDPDCTMQLSVTFSSRTTSMDVQRNLEASVEKRIKSVYGPPLGKILFVFLDDLNMPQVDNYGTQQPIALLKLLLEGGFMYNRGGKPGRKDLHDLHFLAAMGTTGGARHKVDSRFLSLFSIIHVPFPCAESLLSIYTSMLSGHLEPFSEDIQAMCKHITLCTAKLYNFVLQTLPPTPSRFHYIFNMRDLSRVYQGLCLTTHDRYRTKAKMVRVWRNECVRVFHDRLVNETDQALVQDHLLSLLIEHFPEEVEEARQEPLLFGDYWAALNIEETRTYEDLQDYENVRHFFQELLEAYNKSQKTPMNLVLFDYALEHLTRIHRLLRMHWGHAMLVGPPGCGHRSLTRLAAFTAGCQVFELPLSRGYCERVFREDLKKLYLQLGVDNKPTVFLINDSFIIEEGFLEHVNNMLTTGNVPALFSEEELEIALNELREEAGDAGVGVRKKEVWQFFMRRCRDNLHVVFTTSPAGDLLRLRCRSFPGLVNNTGIDWFLPWPHEALLQVAQSFLGDSGMVQEDLMPEVVQHAAMVYHCVEQNSLLFEQQLHRFNHVTPQNYLDCLNTYLHLLQEKNQLIQGQCTRLEGGLRKLQEASEELNELSEKLDEQKHELAEKAKACRTLLEEIAINKETVDAKTALARRKAQEMEEQNGVIAMEKHAAEKALSVALPALVTARLALQNFEKSDVTEIRSFAKPPRQVQMICESIMVIRGYREVNWKAAKAMMAEPNFLRLLVDMDCDSITQNQVKVVKGVLDKLGTTAKDMASISKAGAGMLRFVEAVVAYCDLSKEIKPKRDKMAWLEREYKRSGQQLESIQITVDMLQTEQDRMGDRYEIALKEEVRLKEETQLMETRLDAAEKLFSGLSSENARWHKELEEQCTRQRLLVGNCLLTAAFIAYQGPFTWEFRSKMSREWENDAESRRIPFSQPFQPETLLSDNVETARWVSQGLPPDELSRQNGALVAYGSRVPLCIDPQQQALQWILCREANNNLKVSSLDEPDFLKHLELAMRYGRPFLLRDVEEFLDPILNHVLAKELYSQQGRSFVLLGDHGIEYDPDFRLYLTCKLENPAFPPSVYSRVLVINFTVTTSGLENQLLSIIVLSERSELEEQRERLVCEVSQHRCLLKELEDSLLHKLSTSTGNMLDNAGLVATLEESKTKALEEAEQLQLAEKTTQDIEQLREVYRTVARRSTLLYFSLTDMAQVSPMYQYSLAAYLKVFRAALLQSQPDTVLTNRLDNIMDALTISVYKYGCTGLFEKDKLLFSFNMTLKIEQAERKVLQEELDFFLKGSMVIQNTSKSKTCDWLPNAAWEDVIALAEILPKAFSNLPDNLMQNENEWKSWYDSDNPETSVLPGRFKTILSNFQKLMFLRLFRVDRVHQAITNYISATLDHRFVEPPGQQMEHVLEQSSSTTPVLFLLSPGTDPTAELAHLAMRVGHDSTRLHVLAMGQGQEKAVLQVLTVAITNGHWLVLQNCHLLMKWLPKLEKAVDSAVRPHANFRLWMTTEPMPGFPMGLLQRSLKVVTESPKGLKPNLLATYSKLTDEALQACSHKAFRPLVYVLAFFHGVVQERRLYGKTGWNVPYDFSNSDFQVSLDILKTYLLKEQDQGQSRVPWETLKYLIGEVIYGGRVTDSFDRRVLSTFMDEYLGDFVFNSFQPFFFYHDGDVYYRIPSDGSKQHYEGEIESLPLKNSPEVLGLHVNAGIDSDVRATHEIWNFLLSLQPHQGDVCGGTNQEEILRHTVSEIHTILPQTIKIEEVKEQLRREEDRSPTGVVLLQELCGYNHLLRTMDSSLLELKQAMAGEVAMSRELDGVAQSFLHGQIPDDWRRLAPDTLKALGSWVAHVCRRHEQYVAWVQNGQPMVIWLGGLHTPESYLLALIQAACRRHRWPLDRATLHTEVTTLHSTQDTDSKEEFLASGLHLQGAEWDMVKGCLVRSRPRVLSSELPLLKLIPMQVQRLTVQNTYRAPVYTTPRRRNASGEGLVFEVNLRTTRHSSHWILQGVCLTLNSH